MRPYDCASRSPTESARRLAGDFRRPVSWEDVPAGSAADFDREALKEENDIPTQDRAAALPRDAGPPVHDWRPGKNGSVPDAAALSGLLSAAQAALVESEERHRRVSEELRHRIRFEDLITSISTHFIHLPGDRIDMGINYGLRALAEFAQVDRSYIFLFSLNGTRVDNAYEWCARGIAPRMKRLQGLESARFPWLMERIRALRSVHVAELKELPPEAAAERDDFASAGIQSLAIVPMAHRGTVRGYLGFDSLRVRQDWTEANIQVLRMAGEIFVSALERKHVDQALREAKARYLNIFENAVEGIFQSTPDGRFLGANPALARIFGYADAREMIGSVQDAGTELYVDPLRRAEFLRILQERGRVIEFESQARRKDGAVIIISENARAVPKADGSLDYCEGTVLDVTQRKRMEEQLIHGSLHDAGGE